MVMGVRRAIAYLPILMIASLGCGGNSESSSHDPVGDPPPRHVPTKAPGPPTSPDDRGPPQHLSRKFLEKRLTGARAVSGDDAEEWSFSEKGFTLTAGKKPIPADLLTAIVGPGRQPRESRANGG